MTHPCTTCPDNTLLLGCLAPCELGAAAAERDITPEEEQANAIAAASRAATATADLLRFAQHGPHSEHFAFAEETVGELALALLAAIRIEHPREIARAAANGDGADGANMLNQLAGALDRFVEDWA